MKHIILTLALVLILAATAQAPVAFTLTVSTVSIGLPASIVQGYSPNTCFCTLSGGAINYRIVGLAPTSSVGHELAVKGQIRLESAQEVANFRGIRAGDTDGSLFITCW